MSNFQKVKLGEITDKIGSGATPKGGDSVYKESGITLIRSLNVRLGSFKYNDLAFIDQTQAKKLDNVSIVSGDVLLNITGASVARVCIVPDSVLPARVNQHVSIIRCGSKLNNGYLSHYLASNRMQLFLWQIAEAGATRQAITKEQIENIEIPLPPLEKQKRIATILDTADTIRAKRKKAIAKLDQLARSVFLSMFGPPQSWKMRYNFSAMSSLGIYAKAGKSVEGESIPAKENQYGVLKVSAVTRGFFKPEENKVVRTLPESNVLFPRRGDVLVTRANTRELVAACCVVESDYENVFLSDKIWKIHLPDEVNNYVFKFVVDTPLIHERIISTASGTSGSMLNISQDNFFAEQIPIFPIRTQQRFAERINQIQSIKRMNEIALRKEEALFLSIQEAAFNGNL